MSHSLYKSVYGQCVWSPYYFISIHVQLQNFWYIGNDRGIDNFRKVFENECKNDHGHGYQTDPILFVGTEYFNPQFLIGHLIRITASSLLLLLLLFIQALQCLGIHPIIFSRLTRGGGNNGPTFRRFPEHVFAARIGSMIRQRACCCGGHQSPIVGSGVFREKW